MVLESCVGDEGVKILGGNVLHGQPHSIIYKKSKKKKKKIRYLHIQILNPSSYGI